jgi:hypothetical protein
VGSVKGREGIMVTLKWYSMRLAVMTLALLSVMALPASADVVSAGPKVGQWRTWVLASGTEIRCQRRRRGLRGRP